MEGATDLPDIDPDSILNVDMDDLDTFREVQKEVDDYWASIDAEIGVTFQQELALASEQATVEQPTTATDATDDSAFLVNADTSASSGIDEYAATYSSFVNDPFPEDAQTAAQAAEQSVENGTLILNTDLPEFGGGGTSTLSSDFGYTQTGDFGEGSAGAGTSSHLFGDESSQLAGTGDDAWYFALGESLSWVNVTTELGENDSPATEPAQTPMVTEDTVTELTSYVPAVPVPSLAPGPGPLPGPSSAAGLGPTPSQVPEPSFGQTIAPSPAPGPSTNLGPTPTVGPITVQTQSEIEQSQSNALQSLTEGVWMGDGLVMPEDADPERKEKILELIRASASLINPAASATAAAEALQQRNTSNTQKTPKTPKSSKKGKKRATPDSGKSSQKKARVSTRSISTQTANMAPIGASRRPIPLPAIEAFTNRRYLPVVAQNFDNLLALFAAPPQQVASPNQQQASDNVNDTNAGASNEMEGVKVEGVQAEGGQAEERQIEQRSKIHFQFGPDAHLPPKQNQPSPFHFRFTPRSPMGHEVPVYSYDRVAVQYEWNPKDFKTWSKMQVYAFNTPEHPCTDDIIIVIEKSKVIFVRLPGSLNMEKTAREYYDVLKPLDRLTPKEYRKSEWVFVYLLMPRYERIIGGFCSYNYGIVSQENLQKGIHRMRLVFEVMKSWLKDEDTKLITECYNVQPDRAVTVRVGPYADAHMQIRPHVEIRDCLGTRIIT